mmetsp:Transcript_18716/g.48757  ORF Transcript_18716/g.48757 Transcript_18716/m.48757 type:complete len:123 (+) Transcript_18716:1955-2323(+)
MISLHAVKSVSNTFPFNKGFSRPKSGAQRSAGVKAAAQWKDTLVYTGRMPLEGLEFLGPVSEMHQFVVVEYPGEEERICVSLHDFLPVNPKSPITAARLLSGGSLSPLLQNSFYILPPYPRL